MASLKNKISDAAREFCKLLNALCLIRTCLYACVRMRIRCVKDCMFITIIGTQVFNKCFSNKETNKTLLVVFYQVLKLLGK